MCFECFEFSYFIQIFSNDSCPSSSTLYVVLPAGHWPPEPDRLAMIERIKLISNDTLDKEHGQQQWRRRSVPSAITNFQSPWQMVDSEGSAQQQTQQFIRLLVCLLLVWLPDCLTANLPSSNLLKLVNTFFFSTFKKKSERFRNKYQRHYSYIWTYHKKAFSSLGLYIYNQLVHCCYCWIFGKKAPVFPTVRNQQVENIVCGTLSQLVVMRFGSLIALIFAHLYLPC